MKTSELISLLEQQNPNELLAQYCVVHENYIDFDWDAKGQTVKMLINELKKEDQDTPIYVDVEDGITYREITDIYNRYMSPTLNAIDFIT